MNTLLLLILLQSMPLPARTGMPNPAVTSPVPVKMKKDYDKLWTRFIAGKDDIRLVKDIQKFLKKNKDVDSAVILLGYLDLYSRNITEAEQYLNQVLTHRPDEGTALFYLAEIAFSRGDYSRASDLYARLLAVDKTRTDIEAKRQKALLLATENLLNAAAAAEQSNRLAEAQGFYEQALKIAPQEPVLQAQLGILSARQKKWDEALVHFRREAELEGPTDENQKNLAEALMNLGRTEEARGVLDRLRENGGRDERLEQQVKELEDLGRWGNDIEQFHSIESSPALSREQLAALVIRYFPQVTEFQQTPQIVTDIQGAWARPEIQTVVGVGLLDIYANHTFRPSSPITRGDLAVVLARLFRLLGLSEKTSPPIPASDLASTSAVYREIQLVLGQGMMRLDDAGNFKINASISGQEAVHAVELMLQLFRAKTA